MNRSTLRTAIAASAFLPLVAFAAEPAPPPDPHAGHDMSTMGPMAETDAMGGIHFQAAGWNAMLHGFVNLVHDRQGGPRGDTENFGQSMLMAMADRPLGFGNSGPGSLGVKAMFSLDPAMGKRGYPLLFQTGETADGSHHLVDRQHPHDFVMELSARYSLKLGEQTTGFLYAGLPGEPALGPVAFMHRASGERIPEAPLTHHWLDSTHITFGVATVGVSHGPLKLEASWFNGREPDPHRWNIETRGFDSWSARLTVEPLPQLSMQLSHGDLKSPEQLEPETRVLRTTASASLRLRPGGSRWDTTLAWGLNDKQGSGERRRQPGWLLESTAVLANKYTVFGRAEQVKNDELFDPDSALAGTAYRIRKLTLGGIVDVARSGPVAWGLGASVSVYDKPAVLDEAYGARPRSWMLFLQGRL